MLTNTPTASQCMPSDKLVDSGDKRGAATITDRLTSSASVTSRSALPKFHEFLMVLMKLRLNLYDQDIAYRFQIHQSTVSRKTTK